MPGCCPSSSSKIVNQACLQCGTDCKSVEMNTLYHQVRFPENQEIPPDTYYFCPAKDCPTAYFSNTGTSIPKQHLTTYLHIQNDKLCYCFDIDTTDYLKALSTRHAEAIKNFVIQRTKLGECACEIRNPSGQCCLAKFKQLQNEFSVL